MNQVIFIGMEFSMFLSRICKQTHRRHTTKCTRGFETTFDLCLREGRVLKVCWMVNKYYHGYYRGADKSLARPGRKQDTATEDFEFHISYL